MSSLPLLEMPLHLLGVHQWRNQDANQSIDDFSCLNCHFDRIRAGEVNFCGFVVTVGSAVSNVLHRLEDFFDFGLQFQLLNFLPQPRITLIAVNFSQVCNCVAQPFKTYTQKGACRSWGKIGNALSFHKNFLYGLRHVFAGFNSERLRIDKLEIFPDGHLMARRTDGYMENLPELVTRVTHLIFGETFPKKKVPKVHRWFVVQRTQRGPTHLTGDMAMRASEV